MFKKILLIYSEKLTDKHLDSVEKVKKIIGDRLSVAIRADKIKEDSFDGVDLVITTGGDGVFIQASGFLKKTPILGINSESNFSEGALLSLKEDELGKLDGILEGDYKIIERERIKVKLNGKELEKLALNDVYVGSANQFHTSRYVIKFKGKQEEQRSSGALISTSSGSGAWYKSAGGKEFSDQGLLKFIIREAYFRNLFRPEILDGEIKKGEKIEFESKRHSEGVIAIDSNSVYNFNMDDRVEIEISDCPLRVVA